MEIRAHSLDLGKSCGGLAAWIGTESGALSERRPAVA
jgi:hypothetical protein